MDPVPASNVGIRLHICKAINKLTNKNQNTQRLYIIFQDIFWGRRYLSYKRASMACTQLHGAYEKTVVREKEKERERGGEAIEERGGGGERYLYVNNKMQLRFFMCR
jgi:hypothetical protein